MVLKRRAPSAGVADGARSPSLFGPAFPPVRRASPSHRGGGFFMKGKRPAPSSFLPLNLNSHLTSLTTSRLAAWNPFLIGTQSGISKRQLSTLKYSYGFLYNSE